MTKVAEIEGVGTLEFPDDTPDDVMQKAVMEMVKGNGNAPADAAPPPPPPPPPPVNPQAVAARITDTESPFAQTGLNPERAALYAREQGHPLDALKREIAEAGGDLKEYGSAAVRPFVKAGINFASMLPDAAHSVERFVSGSDHSPTAARKAFIYGPVDPTLPSELAKGALDKYTVAPTTLPGKIAEEISSGLIGAKMPGLPTVKAAPSAPSVADDVIAAGAQHQVPVYFDDVTKSAIAKKLGVGAENVPVVGTSAGRAAQAQAAKDAAGRLAAKYDIADEVPDAIQGGLKDQLQSFRNSADQLYKRAASILDTQGYVDTPGFNEAINMEMQRQAKLGAAANPAVVKLLEKYKNVPGGDFSLMRDIRSQVKGDIADFYRGGENAAIGEKGVERLVKMRDALENDMGTFAKRSGGEGYDAWKQADSFYKTNLVPFKERGFAELVRTGEPEKAWRYLLAQGGIGSRAERMYNSLNESGRAAVRSGLVNDAMSNSLGPKGGFSPAKFARFMEDHSTVVDRFFEGGDRQEINGFTNLMRHVERAGQHMENPPTGQRMLGIGALLGAPGALAGDAGVTFKSLMVAAAGAGGTRVLFQTKRGRDMLLAASKLKPGTPAMNIMANRIGRLMVSGAATPYREPTDEEPADAVGQ